MNIRTALAGRWASFRYAFQGMAVLFSGQANARIHAAFTAAVLIAGWCFGLSAVEWALVALAVGLVLSAEAMNTALELLADKLEPERDPIIKQIKDVAAAAVLLAAIAAAVVGVIVFLPRLLRVF